MRGNAELRGSTASKVQGDDANPRTSAVPDPACQHRPQVDRARSLPPTDCEGMLNLSAMPPSQVRVGRKTPRAGVTPLRVMVVSRWPPGSKQRTFNDTRDLCRSQAYPVFGLPLTEYLGQTLLTSENGVER